MSSASRNSRAKRASTVGVLIVDDNPGDRDLISAYLEEPRGRYDVVGAAALAEGITCATQQHIDVALLDLGLPDCQGLETLLRFRTALPELPVLVVTGLDDVDLGRAAVSVGAQDFLRKNHIDLEFVSRAIDFAVERNKSDAKLDHVNRVLRAIRNVNQLIVRENEPASLIQHACDLLIDTSGYSGAWIILGGGDRPAIGIAQAGLGDRIDGFRRLIMQGQQPKCLGEMAIEDRLQTTTYPAFDCGDCPLAEQYTSGLAAVTAMRHGGRTFGFLGVAYPPWMDVDDEEQELQLELAGDLAFALHTIERTRQRNLAVSETNALLRANQIVLNTRDFVDAAAQLFEICKEQTGATAGYIALRKGENENGVLFLDDGGGGCTVDPSLPMPIRGLRAEAYHENRVVYDNAFATSAHMNLLPAGHAPLRNVMFIPISLDGVVHGIIGLANKSGDFDLDDAKRAKTLGEVTAIALQRSLDIEALKQSEAKSLRSRQVARLGYWELKSLDGTPVWSDELFAIFELDPSDGEPSFLQHEKLVHPEDWPLLQSAVKAGFESGTSYDVVFRIIRAGGETGWVRATGEAQTDKSGSITSLFGCAQDITDLKLAQLEVEQRESFLSMITENMFDMVSLADPQRCCIYASPSFRQLGYEPDEMVGVVLLDFVHTEDRKRIGDLLTEGEEFGDNGRATYRFRKKDGSFAWLESIGKVISSENGAPMGMMFSSRDMTEQKELQSRLAQADRLSNMGMLAAGVAHEINNPLAYVLYNLESLAEDLPEFLSAVRAMQANATSDDARSYVSENGPCAVRQLNAELFDDIIGRCQDALEGAHRIRNIARGLGTFSRVEKDKHVPVNLTHVIEVAVNMAFNEIKYRARLVKDFGRTPPVMASEGRLSQVFLNLFINATHAIDEGHVEENKITVRTWCDDDHVYAEVLDTGSGIAPENIEHLFDPFFTTKGVGVGSGLGLSISKNIVESYDGRIYVASKLGKGTSFVVRLPVAVSSDSGGEDSTRGVQSSRPSVRGRVLLVDDEQAIRRAMARVLRDFETVQAESGAEAKALLDNDQDFDLILCDMMMPEISGMDLHQWLSDAYPELAQKFIFITGGAFTPRAREYLGRVDNIRLEKPFDVNNLKKIVSEFVRLSKGC